MDVLSVFLIEKGINQQVATYLSLGAIVIVIIGVCLLVNAITKRVVLNIVAHMAKNDRFKWNDILIQRKTFQRLAFFIPGIIVFFAAPLFGSGQVHIQRLVFNYILVVAFLVITSFLDSFNDYYNTLSISNQRPIKGFLQVIKILSFIVISIIIIANLIGKSPLIMLSGLGALAAVFSFVFKDLILGLVAGIQLTENNMLRIGDWIEVPKFGADGEVIELSLTTVKVQNFDKTIVALPAYALIADSFKNYRGMLESGGRRIKRSIYVDMSSIRFCDDSMIERLKGLHYLSDHMAKKVVEIRDHNIKRNISEDDIYNGRHLTNIGLFRAYMSNYVKNHPGIHKDMTFMVRQLPPGEYGLPLEIYAFSNSTEWIDYEGIQADILDHLLAIIGLFDLKVYQRPSGHDIRRPV